ncbi:hypothetical protein [Singapore grouper iridovirus]|nr:hypothetical protein [Singapore grouper iridovirus]
MITQIVKYLSLMLFRRGRVEKDFLLSPEECEYGYKCAVSDKSAIWIITAHIDANFMKRFKTEWEENVLESGILVYCTTVTFDAMKKLKLVEGLQLFSSERFLFDLIETVPTHVLWKRIGDEGYPATAKHYPKLLIEDPVCQYYEFKYGDIVVGVPHDAYVVV